MVRPQWSAEFVFRGVRNRGEAHAPSGVWQGRQTTGFLRDAG
jgi:hypothetical protein